MVFRNWVELAVAVVVLLVCVVVKCVTAKKRKKSDGLIGVNDKPPGRSYRLK